MGTSGPSPLKQAWLVGSNLITCAAWARVFLLIAKNGWSALGSDDSDICFTVLRPAIKLALYLSFLELFNCVVGITRSPVAAVLLFSCTRCGVELLVAPMIECGGWEHLLTVTVWSIGDVLRFGCFAIDSAVPGIHLVKSVRFTVGPILFPIGALAGEMMMVIRAGLDNDRKSLFLAASLWPVFFYPMMQQLLKQRRKHFGTKSKKKEIKAV
jgi:hypothetical protein